MEDIVTRIVGLLSDDSLSRIEGEIASNAGCDIYKDNLPLLAGFQKEEIECSMLSMAEIEDFSRNNSEELIEFGKLFLAESNPESLSSGIAISYSIYLIYLKDKGEKQLLDYLKKRRIPKPQKLMKQLQSIGEKMKL
ncbi:MAG: hypothetical protein ABJD58_11805 [Cyclobacteriaceae bacterium]|uniref:hypothetical protein n=1 Tax=Reichenbachiella sp. TaxID=2184521 RepID=UPI0032635E52